MQMQKHLFIFNFKYYKIFYLIIIIFVPLFLLGFIFNYYSPIDVYDSIEDRLLSCLDLFKKNPKATGIIIGNSISLYGIQPEYLNFNKKIEIYNFSIGGCHIATILKILSSQKFFPKILIIDLNFRTIYFNEPYKYIELLNYYKMDNNFEKIKFFFEKELIEWGGTHIKMFHPTHKFQIKNFVFDLYKNKLKTLPNYFNIDFNKNKNIKKTKTFLNRDFSIKLFSDNKYTIDNIPIESKKINIEMIKNGIKYIEHILNEIIEELEIFKKNGTKIIVVRVPHPYTKIENETIKEQKLNLSQFFLNEDIIFIDNDEFFEKYKFFFADSVHLEYESAIKYSLWLSQKINLIYK
ncbi:MAG TPA: hypothetical protein PLD27_12495 [bacterium]|nr:hypothetical protein [bacterium]HOL48578.1 hypothetical protein [bacterium]HPQ20065.1 hypothetical protein [bacterium]